MAFTQYTLYRISDQSRGIFDTFGYKTDDSLATVKASGYFNRETFGYYGPGSDYYIIYVMASDGFATLKMDLADYSVEDVSGGLPEGYPSAAEVNAKSRFAFQEKVTAFGNSITANVNNYAAWACRGSSGELIYVKNAGVGGDTTPQMIARMESDIDPSSTTVFIMEATNDAGSGETNPVTPLEHAQNMLTIANYTISQAMKPVFVLAPPKDDLQAAERIDEMNFYDWCTARKLGIPCYDPWRTFSDTDGNWIAGASDDGTHPVDQINYDVGEILNEQIKNKEYAIPITRNNNHGLISNSLLLDISGSYPTGFNVYGGGSSGSYETSVGGLGNQITAAVNDGAAILEHTFLTLTPGNRYIFTCLFSSTITSGELQTSLYIEEQGSTRHYIMQNCKINVTERFFTIEFEPSIANVRFIASMVGSGVGEMTIAQTQLFDITSNTI